MTHIIMSHPWRHHRVRDVLTVGVDLSVAEARHLVRAGHARDATAAIRPLGGGWYEVPVSDGKTTTTKRVQGYDRALEELRESAGQ